MRLSFLLLMFGLLTGVRLTAGSEVYIELDGQTAAPVELDAATVPGLNLYHPGWFNDPARKARFVLVRSRKPLSPAWQEFQFAFTPRQNGQVRLSLLGSPADRQNSVVGWTVYDDLAVTGGLVKNGDFEQLDDKGEYLDWDSQAGIQPLQTDRGNSARVRFGNPLSQTITVKARENVTISFKAKAGEAVTAPAPPPPATTKKERKISDAPQPGVNPGNEGYYPPNWVPLPLNPKLDSGLPSPARDITAELRQRLAAGEKLLTLPAGRFRLGELTLPAGTTLRGAGIAATVLEIDAPTSPAAVATVTLSGDDITIGELTLTVTPTAFERLIVGRQSSLLTGHRLARLRLLRTNFRLAPEAYRKMRSVYKIDPVKKGMPMPERWDIFTLTECNDLEMAFCRFENFASILRTTHCSRVSVHDNIAINGLHTMIRFYHGSEYLKYFNNWTSHVKHPLEWDGGDCSPLPQLGGVEAAQTVIRTMKPGASGYAGHMTGTYEVFCYANYSEYGKTLAWGRKGRRVVVSGNSSRYMYDMAYDAEGCEEIIVADNLALNSKAAGIGCFYSNRATVITGNIVVIEDKGHDLYKGQFVRIHANGGVMSERTLIADNLFVSRLKEPRYLVVDNCRSLTVANNQFVNGGIRTNPYGGGNLIVTGNSFLSSLPRQETLVKIEKVVREFTFRHNTMVNENPQAAPGDPAIELNFGPLAKNTPITDSRFRQLDGNSIRGWQTSLAIVNTNPANDIRLVLLDNLYDGVLRLPPALPHLIERNNTKL